MVIVETSIFTRQVRSLLSAEEYRELQMALVSCPSAGSIIIERIRKPKERCSARLAKGSRSSKRQPRRGFARQRSWRTRSRGQWRFAEATLGGQGKG
jgi:hypothetical protein